MRREWIEITLQLKKRLWNTLSPSMRREWIEIQEQIADVKGKIVSLHAEGVD